MAMETQLQIRQNAMEVQEYMKDLFDWQKNIKDKEKQQVQQGSTGVPAPRGRAQTAAVTAAPAELQKPGLPPSGKKAAGRSATSSHPSSRKDTSNGSSAAAHTYSSYSKWDKMDVDAMLASSGSEDEAAPAPRRPEAVSASTAQEIVHPMQAPGHNAAAPVVAAPRQPLPADELLRPVATTPTAPDVAKTEPEPVSNGQQASSKQPSQQQQRGDPPPVRNSEPQTADAWRTRGNELFKAGQWAFAKQCYGRSLTLDPSNVAALANRAMAELKLQEWAEAEEDCTAALQLDPVHVKAYHRRGTARRQLGKHLQAAQDFEAALLLEPGNAVLVSDRAAALADHLKSCGIPPPSRRVRLPITLAPPPPPPTQAAAVNGNHQGPAGAAVQPKAPQSATAAGTAQQPASSAGQQEATSPQQGPAPAPVQVEEGPSSTGHSPVTSPSAGKGGDVRSRVAAAAEAAAAALASRSLQAARPPKTSTEFEASWRSLKGDLTAQASYLSLLQPESLPHVFKSSLTPGVLAGILRTLLTTLVHAAGGDTQGQGLDAQALSSLAPAHALALLAGLGSVPRIEMAAMCIPGKERSEFTRLWGSTVALPSAAASLGVDSQALAAARAVQAKLKL